MDTAHGLVAASTSSTPIWGKVDYARGMRWSAVWLVLVVSAIGCGSDGGVGEVCDVSGDLDECEEGAICTAQEGDEAICRVLCPPKWTTVVSEGSARRVARRGSKICTGFHPTDQIRSLFDAYRAEAKACGFNAGPEHVALRRRVVVAQTEAEAKRMSHAMTERYMRMVVQDPRFKSSPVPDSPERGGGFSVSEDEFIAGTPETVAERIIDQCRRVGAGHFLAVLHWGAGIDEVSAAHELFGSKIIPALRKAQI